MERETNLNQALMQAAERGDLSEVQRLVESGADVNFTAAHDFRPLLMAVYYAHREVVEYLIGRGADVNYAGFNEGTALMFASGSGDAVLASLLLESGADPNVAMARSGETALHVAV